MDELPIDRDLFDLLVCPDSRAPLKLVDGRLVSTDEHSRRSYRIVDGIPVMLVERSEVLSVAQWAEAMKGAGPVGEGIEAVRRRDVDA